MRDGDLNERQRPDVRVVTLTTDDLAEIAELHLRAFPDTELDKHGPEAVRRSYRWQFEGPHDLTAIGARIDGRLVGFLFGGVFRNYTLGFIKQEWRFLALHAVRHPGTMLRGANWSRVARGLRPLFRRTPQVGPEQPESGPVRSFGVLSIAVDPTLEGQGIGQRIMAEAEREAVALGFEQMHLTVQPGNERAVRFYERGGWVTKAVGDHGWTGLMVRPLPPAR